MLVHARINVYIALIVLLKKIFFFFALAFTVNFIFIHFNLHEYAFPQPLVLLLTSAISIFLGFRVNAAFRRWLAAAKAAGQLISNSRLLVSSMLVFFKDDPNESQQRDILNILFKHIAYVNLVRLQLRKHSEEDFEKEIWTRKINGISIFTDEEVLALKKNRNRATALLNAQCQAVTKMAYKNDISDFRLIETLRTLSDNHRNQAQMEGMKVIPFSWGYSFYTTLLVWIFPMVFIFSQFNTISYTNNIIIALIATVFVTIDRVAKNLDSPFENKFSDVPISAICGIIEISICDAFHIPHSIKMGPVNGVLN